MKKRLLHLYWLLNVRVALKSTSLPANVKKDVYKTFIKCYELLKKNDHSEINCKIGNHSFSSPNPETLQLLLREIMINEQYFVKLNTDTPFIIDCGSNIGSSILYFKIKYPNARIIGIEANPETFKILSANVKQFSNVTVYNAFVHSDDKTKIKLFTDGAGDVSASFDPVRGGQSSTDVDTISLDTLIGNEQVDLLKMDIEGGEFAIFNNETNVSYLKNVNQILLEYHHLINSKMGNSLGAFLSLFENNGFIYNISATESRNETPYFQDIFLKMKRSK